MKTLPSKTQPNNCPEFAVRRETINCFFHPPVAPSTFYALVNKGIIVPLKALRGFYLLNASLRRLGLREVPSLREVSGLPESAASGHAKDKAPICPS